MNIKDIRLRKGLTQADVAAALGVSSVVYSRYETGKRQPSIDMLIQMADIFGVTVDFLLGRQDIEDSTLSDYELQLLIASRKADERAKQDALNMLLAHAANTKTEDNSHGAAVCSSIFLSASPCKKPFPHNGNILLVR